MATETPTESAAPAESSSAPIEIPSGEAYTAWRMTGKLPAAKPAAPAKGTSTNEGSAPSSDSSAGGTPPAENSAPASEAGKPIQEKGKPRSSADTRLTELLNDLREAGLTPTELKTFRQTFQRTQPPAAAAPAAPGATEQTVKPAPPGDGPPVEPKEEDFKTFGEFRAAERKYYKELTEYTVRHELQSRDEQRAQEASQATVREKMEEARGRYGDEGTATISAAARALAGNGKDLPATIPQQVIGLINDSPVWPDLLYTLGGKAEDLAAFVHLAQTNPGEAIRKIVAMEQLITVELAKAKSGAGEGGEGGEGTPVEGTPGRDASGKFLKPPEKRQSQAPPPAHEVSGRGAAPPDAEASATKNNDFRALKRIWDAKELAKRRGR